jgi:hypothetical protein
MSRIKELFKIINDREYNFNYDNKIDEKITMEEHLIIKSYINDDLELIKLCIRDIYKRCKSKYDVGFKKDIFIEQGFYFYRFINEDGTIMYINNYEEKHRMTKEWLITRSFKHMLFNNKIHLDMFVYYFSTLQKLVRYYYSLDLTSLDFFKFDLYFDFEITPK